MRMRRVLIATAAVSLAGLIFAQSNTNSPIHLTDRQQDVYAIYSLLMPGAVLANLGTSQNQRWAIADTTMNDADISPALAPEAALRAPADHPRRFHDAVVDYQQRRHERQPVIRAFHLDRPYILLTPADIQEFRTSRTSISPSSASRQRFSGFPGINFFSDVYFNPERSAALVYMVAWCASLCSQGEWVYLEKQNGRWVQRSGQAAIVPGGTRF